jgi:hypothetical protein
VPAQDVTERSRSGLSTAGDGPRVDPRPDGSQPQCRDETTSITVVIPPVRALDGTPAVTASLEDPRRAGD